MSGPLEMTDMDVLCETDHCKSHKEHGRHFCAECRITSIWAADDKAKRELGIYPSRTNGNKTTEEIEAMARDPQAPPLRKARLAGQKDHQVELLEELIDRGYLQTHLATIVKQPSQSS